MKEEAVKNVAVNETINNTSKKAMKGNAAMNKKTPAAKVLTDEEKKQLKELNTRILDNLTRNYELGKALREVKTLLEGTTEKFGDYCETHYKLAHSQVNRLMKYAIVRDNLGLGDQNVFIPENTLRGLDKYDAELQRKIWEEAKALAGDQKMPTTAQVQDARKKVAPMEDGSNPADMKKQFHSRALNSQVDLEQETPVEVVRKAETVAKVKAVIREIAQRVEMTAEERNEICEFIKAKAEAEAMDLMTRKAESEDREDAEVKAA